MFLDLNYRQTYGKHKMDSCVLEIFIYGTCRVFGKRNSVISQQCQNNVLHVCRFLLPCKSLHTAEE